MKKCPNCDAANSNNSTHCFYCEHSLAAAPRVKAPRQRAEKVKLYHGPWVSKSTARWLARKNQGCSWLPWALFVFMVAVALAGWIGK
jgi:hypothetical protein